MKKLQIVFQLWIYRMFVLIRTFLESSHWGPSFGIPRSGSISFIWKIPFSELTSLWDGKSRISLKTWQFPPRTYLRSFIENDYVLSELHSRNVIPIIPDFLGFGPKLVLFRSQFTLELWFRMQDLRAHQAHLKKHILPPWKKNLLQLSSFNKDFESTNRKPSRGCHLSTFGPDSELW